MQSVTGMKSKKEIIKSMSEFDNQEYKDIEEMRAYIRRFFTDKEIQTMKYIAQNMESKEIAQKQKVTKSTIERRKEYIIEKIEKNFKNFISTGKQILTIKNFVYSFHLLDDNISETLFLQRLEDFIKIRKNQ